VNEDVLAAAFRRDEAKSFGCVEELYGADGHVFFHSVVFRPRDMRRRRWKDENISFGSLRLVRRSGAVVSTGVLRLTGRKYHHDLHLGRDRAKRNGAMCAEGLQQT